MTDQWVERAYLTNLRHELRTPINAIIGYSEMLLEEQQPPDPDLEKVLLGGRQLLTQVNQLLAPANGKGESLDLQSLADQVHHHLRTPLTAVIGYTELLLEEADPDQAPDLVKIHSAALRMLELIQDVINLAQEGGLAGVTVEQDPTVALIQSVATSLHSPTSSLPTVNQGKILVVDDNPVNRDLLLQRLSRQGYEVTTAADGQEALEHLATAVVDLLLLDVIMPQMNGLQVLQTLKADQRWRDIPVIMISALDELDSVVYCIEIGAEDYLQKPFNPVLLQARINACLEKKRLRDQEVEYLRQVASLTAAAAAVETATFDPVSLAGVAARRDALGNLARVFQRMAQEVYLREQRLKQQIQSLRIEIDQSKRARQVAEITETDYFQQLQRKAKDLRKGT